MRFLLTIALMAVALGARGRPSRRRSAWQMGPATYREVLAVTAMARDRGAVQLRPRPAGYNTAHPDYGYVGDPLRPLDGRYYGYLIYAGLY